MKNLFKVSALALAFAGLAFGAKAQTSTPTTTTTTSTTTKSGIRYSKLLKDSLHLQAGLRELTHQVLAAQEDERTKMSQELQNEIAQTLLGINARLLSLQKAARGNTHGLQNEIATAQRLVVKSARSVRRLAREFRSA